MYGPTEIVDQAARSYRGYLRCVVTGEAFFPLLVPFGKTSIRETDFTTLQSELAQLKASKAGFVIEWTEKSDRRWGKQRFPSRIYFATAHDYLNAIGKLSEADTFIQNLESTRMTCPELEGWLAAHVMKVVENAAIWQDILKVCRYFLDNPRPGRFLRELPIAIDTKFIERNEAIIARLLQYLIPGSIRADARSFEEKFGLLSDQPLIRFRILDERLRNRLGLAFNDLAVPVEELAVWKVSGIAVVITENKTNFMTLPSLPNAIGIWGGGGAASLLIQCRWLESCRIVYWGDIDVSGFEILSRLRSCFPHLVTLMMDDATLRRFIHFAVQGKRAGGACPASLTPAERAAFERVNAENLMLEQEKLPKELSQHLLQSLIRYTDTDSNTNCVLIEGYRKMTPAQKLHRVRALTQSVQELALVDIRRRHPDADETEQRLRLASRWIATELMRHAFGWDTQKAGY